jgi:hypothetical protein
MAPILTALLAGIVEGRAGDLSGNARVTAGSSDDGEESESVLTQDYNLRLVQPLTPWLGLHVSYQATDFDTEGGAAGTGFERDSREPAFELVYGRDTLNARLGARDRRTRGTTEAEVLDAAARYAHLSFRPAWGPKYSLRYDRSTNVADVAVFGRDLDTRNVDFDTSYVARQWSARYSWQDFRLDNNLTGYALQQQRHLAQASWDGRFLADRVIVSADGLLRRTEESQRAATGQRIAEPVPAREGLAAIDTTPELGSLDPVPTLVDGDRVTPAAPRIEIGGANTHRNVGLDLGFTRQVTRLEISVDALSDPTVVWQVYRGPDNLTWDAITGVLATFDPTLLRYTLTFPETTDRHFKAVNVSVNTRPAVAVTEVRALLDVDLLGESGRRSTTERAYLLTEIRPTGRVSARVSLGTNSDSGSGALLPFRDTREWNGETLLAIGLTDTLDARFLYHRSRFTRGETPVLRRGETRADLSLAWTPLPSVNALFSAGEREESESGRRLRRTRSMRGRALTELLPGLRLTSEVARESVEDPFSGFDLSSWLWKEVFEMQPLPGLTLYGGGSIHWLDATSRINVTRRTSAYGRLDWTLLPTLTVSADWSYGSEDGRRTVSQRYALSFAPGPRLSLSASWFESDALGDLETSSAGASLDYRLNASTGLFLSASRSELDIAAGGGSRVESLEAGVTVAF